MSEKLFKKLELANANAELFMKESEKMDMENYCRLKNQLLEILIYFNKGVYRPDLDDAAMSMANQLDRAGSSALEKWGKMHEAFRLSE